MPLGGARAQVRGVPLYVRGASAKSWTRAIAFLMSVRPPVQVLGTGLNRAVLLEASPHLPGVTNGRHCPRAMSLRWRIHDLVPARRTSHVPRPTSHVSGLQLPNPSHSPAPNPRPTPQPPQTPSSPPSLSLICTLHLSTRACGYALTVHSPGHTGAAALHAPCNSSPGSAYYGV